MWQNELVAQLIESPERATDLDPRVLETYIQECTAEAQEGSYPFTRLKFSITSVLL